MSWVEAARSIGGSAALARDPLGLVCSLRWRESRRVRRGRGFRPMYGTSSLGGSNVNEKLAKIEIAPVPGRVGQRIRNELIFTTTGGGAPLPPEYRLEVVIKETLTSTLVRKDGEAQGTVYNLDAKFRLIKLADKPVVLEGASYGRAAFERFKSVFANVRAREDAENRAAETVGTELKGRLAAYLAGAS